jgi:hypothetical protein
LVKFVSGQEKDADGKVKRKRPHFLSIIYALMNYENHTHQSNYPLTYNYIWGKLTEPQKQELEHNIDQLKLAESIKDYLTTQLTG